MKKLLGALLAVIAIGTVASPALANEDDEAGYGQYFGGYQNFEDIYRHDWAGIDHGMRDGSYTRREARYFTRRLQDIRRRELYFRSRDGWIDPREGAEIRDRLAQLHDEMHQAHQDGHAAIDDWNAESPGYNGYGTYGYRH